ncbi:MAG TPA: glycosyltransferase family 1 protein [Candidatus Sumerlaeota bacterium]|nr:glycosyltransferase family 1 protein [Candidatus Sumerlaeota bacterium]
MNIGVNGIRLVTPKSGVGRYIENVLRCWNDKPGLLEKVHVHTPLPMKETLPAICENIVTPARGGFGAWEQFQLPKAHGERDVLFCPSYIAPVRAKAPVVLVHHGSYEAYPEEFSWWTRWKSLQSFRMSARRADVLITVSENSRRDIAKYYKVSADKVHMIPEGVDTTLFRPLHDEAAARNFREKVLGADLPFFLFVGKPVRRRNIPAMLAAFKRLKEERKIPHKFVIIGSDLPGLPVGSVVREMNLEGDVVLRGYASHEEMTIAYNAAECLVYPSSYEGFGMPVLEAMACGTPAIALNNSAFPEFAGGVALLAREGTADCLYDAMKSILDDDQMRRRMREDGPARAAAYDWKLIAERTRILIEELAARQ